MTNMENSFGDVANDMSNGYFLASRDIARQSSSFCSKRSSTMMRLYLRACEIKILSLNLSEWLE